MNEEFAVSKQKLSKPYTKEMLLSDKTPLSELIINSKKKIEEVDDFAFIDFANMYVGGGCLVGGSQLQEQILFTVFPEACICIGLCSVMEDHDAISVEGLHRSANYSGYSSSFKYTGPMKMYDASFFFYVARILDWIKLLLSMLFVITTITSLVMKESCEKSIRLMLDSGYAERKRKELLVESGAVEPSAVIHS